MPTGEQASTIEAYQMNAALVTQPGARIQVLIDAFQRFSSILRIHPCFNQANIR